MALESARGAMDKAIGHMETELTKIRAGKAHPAMLDSVMVEYYGSMTPLTQVSNINTSDARTLTVQAWEKAMLDPIATAIINANLGLNPMNNGESILINIPPLTEERRKDLTKRARAEGEHEPAQCRRYTRGHARAWAERAAQYRRVRIATPPAEHGRELHAQPLCLVAHTLCGR